MEPVVRVHPLGCDFTLEVPQRHVDWYEGLAYEPMSTALFRTISKGADVVVDIGAHMGYYSLVAKSAEPTASVIAVEASPENAEVLRRNVADAPSPAPRVFSAAFGPIAGSALLQLTEASDNQSLSGHPDSPTVATVEVPMVTAAELGLPPGGRLVVKVDVEGHEMGVLDGLEAAFAQYEDVRILMELNPRCLRHAGSSADALVARLQGLGFRLFVLKEESRTWHEIDDRHVWSTHLDEDDYANVYAVPKERCRSVSAVLHAGGVGGAERTHAELVEALVQRGAMVHSIVPVPDLGIGTRLRALGTSVDVVDRVPWWTVESDASTRGDDQWSALRVFDETIVGLIGQVGADVVLTETSVTAAGAVAAAELDRPHVWFVHEFGDLDHGLAFPGGPRVLGEAILALSDLVLVNSDAVAQHLFGEHALATHVIPPTPAIDPRDARVSGTAHPWTLAVVGSLNEGKGQSDAVSAVAALRVEGLDVHLTLIGPDVSGGRLRLEALAAESGVADLVDFRGVLDAAADIYEGVDVVAITSRAEAFGRVPFEATAFLLPVIYADAGGLADYMIPEVSGLPYQPGDVGALAAAIRRLHDNPDGVSALIASARASLLSPERRERFGRDVYELLRGIVGRGPRSVVERMVDVVARDGMEQLEAAHVATEALRGELALAERRSEEVAGRLSMLESTNRDLAEARRAEAIENERLRVTNALLVAERDEAVAAQRKLDERLRGLEETVAAMEKRHSDLDAERMAVVVQLDGAQRLLADLDVERGSLSSALDDTQHRLALVLGSRTWRLRGRVRRLFGRAG